MTNDFGFHAFFGDLQL